MSVQRFIEKIKKKETVIGVIGLGYAGLPVAVKFAEKGFKVIGVDINKSRVEQLKAGKSFIEDIPPARVGKQVRLKRLHPTDNSEELAVADAVIICVPTPLRKTKEPDISYIIKAIEQIPAPGGKDRLLALQSTTFPGTTEEIMLPYFEKSGRKLGKNFFLVFAPERVDPGNKKFDFHNTPKIVGGDTAECRRAGKALFEQVVDKVVPVSSTRVAEMVKLLENTYRTVNIALVNELALMCHKMGLDVWEVIEAASTKPFGFMPFFPGPGLGGHCLPVDPLYLSWKAKVFDFDPRFIDLASAINARMPQEVVYRLADILNTKGKALHNAKILLLGVAYKKNISDVRESPALDIFHMLKEKESRIIYHDPHVPEFTYEGKTWISEKLSSQLLKSSDLVVLLTDHDAFDLDFICKHSRLIFDTRNAVKNHKKIKEKVIRL